MYNYMNNPGWGNNGSWSNPTQPFGLQTQTEQIKRVHGEEGAKAYPLAPNSSVLLQDETDNIVWAKVTDSAGYATVKGFFLTPIVNTTPTKENEYASKEEFDELKAKFDKLMEELK